MKIGDRIVIRSEFTRKEDGVDEFKAYNDGLIVEQLAADDRLKLSDTKFRVLWSNGKLTVPTNGFLEMFRVVQSFTSK